MEAAEDDSEEWETDTQEWSETALMRAKAVIQAFSEMPSKRHKPFGEFPSESGIGGSSLFGSSMPKMDPDSKDRRGGEVEGSSGFFTETDLLCQGSLPERPRSKLTVKNVQKHDAISGKAKITLDDVSWFPLALFLFLSQIFIMAFRNIRRVIIM